MSDTPQKQRILNDAQLQQIRSEIGPILKAMVNDLRTELPSLPRGNENRLVSRRDAARMLGVSIQTIVKMFERGELTFSRIGRRVLIRESDVAMLINHRTSNPDDAQ